MPATSCPQRGGFQPSMCQRSGSSGSLPRYIVTVVTSFLHQPCGQFPSKHGAFPSKSCLFTLLRTLFRNGALPTTFFSIVSALFPMPRRVCPLPPCNPPTSSLIPICRSRFRLFFNGIADSDPIESLRHGQKMPFSSFHGSRATEHGSRFTFFLTSLLPYFVASSRSRNWLSSTPSARIAHTREDNPWPTPPTQMNA
jgi:hypothetical protein